MEISLTYVGEDRRFVRLLAAVTAFLNEVSAGDPADVISVQYALQQWRSSSGTALTATDRALLNGTIEAMKRRVVHGVEGEPIRPELDGMDLHDARPN